MLGQGGEDLGQGESTVRSGRRVLSGQEESTVRSGGKYC